MSEKAKQEVRQRRVKFIESLNKLKGLEISGIVLTGDDELTLSFCKGAEVETLQINAKGLFSRLVVNGIDTANFVTTP